MSARFESVVEFAPMREEDLAEVLAIEFCVCDFPWGRGNFADSLSSGYRCWVCRFGGGVIGYYVLMLVVDEAHLLTICVEPTHQGQGYGARLLRHAMRTTQESRATTLLLEVRPSNLKALALYRHYGFRQIGVRRGYYPAATGREDALILTLPLAENQECLA